MANRHLCINQCLSVWPRGIMIRALDFHSYGREFHSCLAFSGNNLGHVFHTSASVTKQYNFVPLKGR